jgi:hypothetical protein
MIAYYDKHNNRIKPGMRIRCTFDSSVEQVYEYGGDLCIRSDVCDGLPPTYFSLLSFVPVLYPLGSNRLENFEIVSEVALTERDSA